MPKAPLPENEEKRQQTLSSFHILESIDEAEFNELVELASGICNTPISLITIIDNNRQWFKARKGTDVTETPRDIAFCAHTILNPGKALVVNDARTDSRFQDNPLVIDDPNVVFYAGVPLVSEEGDALGTLCVLDVVTHELTESQLNSLHILGKQVMQRLEYRRKLKQLEDANSALLESNMLIQKFARSAAHDIKNPMSSIMLSAQIMHQAFARLEDKRHVEIAERSVNACKQLISMVNDMLEYARSPQRLLDGQQQFSLNALLNKVISLIDKPENVAFELPETDHTLTTSTIALEQIFLNLITNAIRYNNKPEIKVGIRFCEDEQHYHFKVIDNGIGIEPKFIEQIFEESFTTGINDRFNNKGTGIGLHTVKALVQKLNGNVTAQSVPGKQTTISFWLKK